MLIRLDLPVRESPVMTLSSAVWAVRLFWRPTSATLPGLTAGCASVGEAVAAEVARRFPVRVPDV